MTCEGEFYSTPPQDHVDRYKWAIERLNHLLGQRRAWVQQYPAQASLQEDYSRGTKVVDVGCGSGYGVQMLAEAGYDAVGLERNPMALEFCRSRCAPAYLHDYGNTGGLFRRSGWLWVAAVLLEVIEHNANGLDLLGAAMDDSTIVLASVPYNEAPGTNPYHHLHGLTEESITEGLRTRTHAKFEPSFTRQGSSLLIEWTRW